VGTAEEPIVVPPLVDADDPLSFEEAQQLLADLGLEIEQGPNIEVEFGSPFAGNVAEQSPPPGTEVASGAVITVSLGEEPEARTVPDVVGPGMDEAQAQAAIEAAGLVFVRGPDVPNSPADPKPGQAASQNPAAGENVAANSEVTVSFYEDRAIMPDLVGMTLNEATRAMETAGLVLVEGETCGPESVQNVGRIAWQEFAPGALLTPGSEVTVRRGQLNAEACPAPPT
jgi:serine/threonine-protein kinase